MQEDQALMTNTLKFLQERNTRTIWLRETLRAGKDGAERVVETFYENTPGAQPFVIKRVNAKDVGRAAMQVLAGDSEFVKFAQEEASRAQQNLEDAKKKADPGYRKSDVGTGLEQDERNRAAMLSLIRFERRALLREGMLNPPGALANIEILGPYELPLYDAIRTFGTHVVTDDPKS